MRRDTGHPPPVIDTLFAATAIKTRFSPVSLNVRDLKLSGAGRFDPWNDDPAAFRLVRRS